jgi:hypothetical protein
VDASSTQRERDRVSAALRKVELEEPDLPREMDGWLAATLAGEPWPHVMGPLLDRGAPSGLVLVGGEEVARWGDPGRREMVFSIAKSALGTSPGLPSTTASFPTSTRRWSPRCR